MATVHVGGMMFAVATADEAEAAAVAERAYWDCAGPGVFVPDYHFGGFAFVGGRAVAWKRVA